MALPAFDANGELPIGVHAATLDEVVGRFGSGSRRREEATERLKRVHRIATATGKLDRFVIFGSYVTAKHEPNDVDVFMIMKEDFVWKKYDAETQLLYSHLQAQAEFGASVFWAKPSIMFLQTEEDFVADWQFTRDQTRRGIVEVMA